MAKRIMFVLSLFLILLLVNGCTSSPDVGADVDVGEEETEIPEEIVLKAVTFQHPDKIEDSIVVFREYVNRVNNAGEGEIRIDIIGGPEAIPMADQLESTMSGVVDIAMVWPVHMPTVPEGRAVMTSLLAPWEEREGGFYDIYDKANNEVGLKVLGRMNANSGFFFYSTKKIETINDFKGLKCRSNVGLDPWVQGLGMVPVHIGLGDLYTSLDRGVIEVTSFSIYGADLAIHEVCDYVLFEEVTPAQNMFAYMNLEKFNQLPEHLQDLLIETAAQLEHDMLDIVEDLKEKEIQRLQDAGIEFVKLKTDEDRKVFFDIAYGSRWDHTKASFLERGLSEDYFNIIKSMIYDDVIERRDNPSLIYAR